MKHVFKLRERLLGRPGPVYNPWVPVELAAAGIGAILTVNEGYSVYPDDLIAAGIEHASFPMADNAPPRPGDFEHCVETLPAALEFVLRKIDDGKTVMIHCTAGKDRTGLTMCYYLCQREGYSAEDAILEVRRVRPEALSALDYEPFAIDVLNALA